jgi:hypothetical protein
MPSHSIPVHPVRFSSIPFHSISPDFCIPRGERDTFRRVKRDCSGASPHWTEAGKRPLSPRFFAQLVSGAISGLESLDRSSVRGSRQSEFHSHEPLRRNTKTTAEGHERRGSSARDLHVLPEREIRHITRERTRERQSKGVCNVMRHVGVWSQMRITNFRDHHGGDSFLGSFEVPDIRGTLSLTILETWSQRASLLYGVI